MVRVALGIDAVPICALTARDPAPVAHWLGATSLAATRRGDRTRSAQPGEWASLCGVQFRPAAAAEQQREGDEPRACRPRRRANDEVRPHSHDRFPHEDSVVAEGRRVQEDAAPSGGARRRNPYGGYHRPGPSTDNGDCWVETGGNFTCPVIAGCAWRTRLREGSSAEPAEGPRWRPQGPARPRGSVAQGERRELGVRNDGSVADGGAPPGWEQVPPAPLVFTKGQLSHAKLQH